jgi:putative ABC transport system permease protein
MLRSTFLPRFFVSLAQFDTRNVRLLVRGGAGSSRTANDIRRAVQNLDPHIPLEGVQTLESALSATIAQPRFFANALSYFALAALWLVATGLYGIIAQSVQNRTHEIGVRMALGADHWSVRFLVLLNAVRLTAIGALIGTGGALVMTQSLRTFVYGVDPFDARHFVVALAVLFAAALLAAFLPALRASQVQPTRALASD